MSHRQPGSSGTTACQHPCVPGALLGQQLEPTWKGLKVKPTRCAHTHRNTAQLGEKGRGNRLENAARKVYVDFAPFLLSSSLTMFELLLAVHHLLLFLKKFGRTSLNCSSFHQLQPVRLARATGHSTRLLPGPEHSCLWYPSQLCSPSEVLTEVTPHPHAHKQLISHTAPKQFPKPKNAMH